MSPTLDLGGAYEFIWSGTLSMDAQGGPLSGNVSGQYLNTSMSVLTLYLNWKM